MKRRLKRSFLTATMISATLVIVILMGIVNLLTAIERNNSDMEILNYLAANGGTFPIEEMDILDVFSGEMPLNIDPHDPDAMDIHPDSSGGSSEESAEEAQKGSAEGAPEGSAEEAPEGSNDAEHDADNNVNSEKTDNRFNDLNNDNTDAVKFRDSQPRSDGNPFSSRRITVETPYERRFFSVLINDEGEVLNTDISHIAAYSADEADDIALSLYNSGKASGSFSYFRYTSVTGQDDSVLYVFLDCSSSITAGNNFLLYSIIVTVIGLIVLFGIAWLVSGKAISPIIESYNKQKSFITNAGHELKTPLAVIESNTEVVELENGESQWTQSIHHQVRRLSDLTRDLIALSRMDEEGIKPELEPVDISETVSETLEPYSLMAEQYGLSLSSDITPGLEARSYRNYIEKIVTILADNAVKYTSAEGTIYFSLTKEGSHIVLCEKNPADELTAGKQDKLFDRFYRGDTSRSSETQGYGLGLPMARQMAESLGGSIRADSPDGKNIIITVHLT